MKTIKFKTEEEFNVWVAEGNELYCIYDKQGNEVCDVEEPVFIQLVNLRLVDSDTRCIRYPLAEYELEWLKDLFATQVIIEEEEEERRAEELENALNDALDSLFNAITQNGIVVLGVIL